jgi:phage baseplate assembly protein W|tara:strand:+ start:776 stop:1198 length:423 start_codon:yes stop_codon:yes gene_type:complete
MAVEITYSDLDVDLAKNSFTGDASTKKDLHAIRQSVQNILLTRKGEKPFDPFFGSEIDNFMFEQQGSFLTTITLKNRIETTINKLDPRVKYEDFVYLENLSTDDTAYFELKYKVKTLGQDLAQGDTTEIADGLTIIVERA